MSNKRGFRADGLPLRPSALRPCLLRAVIILSLGLFFVNFSIPVSALSLTLIVPSDALSLNIQPTSTFTKSSPSSVSVKTDAFAGYSLTLRSKTDNYLLNDNNKIPSILNKLTTEQYEASGNTNTWGYQPSKVNNEDNIFFLPGPISSETIIEKTEAKNDEENSYSITLGAKIDGSMPKGEYSNTFIFSATANTVSYNIKYNLNQGTWTGQSPQIGNTAENVIAISNVQPTRESYTFKGWCSTSTKDDSCPSSNKIYQPGEQYILSNDNNDVTLYAMWHQNDPTDRGDLGPMQDFNCSTMPNYGDTAKVKDVRDNNAYKIAKLADGKCWMTENLRIIGRTIDYTNSDIISGSYNVPNQQRANFKTTINDTDSNHAYYGGNQTYGAYYTWYAATAGSGVSSITTDGATAPNSICPHGWRLPIGGSAGDFQKLMAAYNIGSNPAGSQAMRNPPLNFTYSGGVLYGDGSLYGQGSGGYYWSSTVHDATHIYYLDFNDSIVYPAYNNFRMHGYAIRCIAK